MDTANIILWIGQILFGGYFFIMGINHFIKHKMLSEYAKSKKVPMASEMVYASGAMLFLGGLGVLLGVYMKESLILIIIFLIPVSIKMHAFWEESGPTKMVEMQNFLKNIALIGASLMLIFFSLFR